jgi:hypothetical protein
MTKQVVQKIIVTLILSLIILAPPITPALAEWEWPDWSIPTPRGAEIPKLDAYQFDSKKAFKSSQEFEKYLLEDYKLFYPFRHKSNLYRFRFNKDKWPPDQLAQFYKIYPEYAAHRSDPKWSSLEIQRIHRQTKAWTASINGSAELAQAPINLVVDVAGYKLIGAIARAGGFAFKAASTARAMRKESRALARAEAACPKPIEPHAPEAPRQCGIAGGVVREVEKNIVKFPSRNLGSVEINMAQVFQHSQIPVVAQNQAMKVILKTADEVLDHPNFGRLFTKDQLIHEVQRIRVIPSNPTFNGAVNRDGTILLTDRVFTPVVEGWEGKYYITGIEEETNITFLHELVHKSANINQTPAIREKYRKLVEGMVEFVAKKLRSAQGGDLRTSRVSYLSHTEIIDQIEIVMTKRFNNPSRALDVIGEMSTHDPKLLNDFFDISHAPKNGIFAWQNHQAEEIGFADYVTEQLNACTTADGHVTNLNLYGKLMDWIKAWQ